MTTFADRLLVETINPPHYVAENYQLRTRALVAHLQSYLRSIPVIEISNVAEFFYAGTDQEEWNLSDFPCVAPPWPIAFFEWRRPSKVVSSVHGVSDSAPLPEQVGFWVEAKPQASGGWELAGLLILLLDRRIYGPCGGFYLTVEPDGSIKIERDADGNVISDRLMYAQTPDHDMVVGRARARLIQCLRDPLLLSLVLLNCKNTTLRSVTPNEKLSRARAKRRGASLLKYHTLEIERVKTILRAEADMDTTGLRHSLHICRGHFKDYRERGLFGRNKGIYWWEHHVRGSTEVGIVDKDYSVNRP